MPTIVGTVENDVLTGTPEADLLQAEPAGQGTLFNRFIPNFGDTLSGGAGDDTLVGGAGGDILDGGEGDDTVILSGLQPWGVEVLLGQDVDGHQWFGIPEGAGLTDEDRPNGVDRLVSVENIIGSGGDDDIVGGAGANRLQGGLGADILAGVGGDDVLRGGQGNDVLRGGDGDDFVSGDRGDDTMSGGSGADVFHTFGGAGIDRVTDFSLAEGDRVQLDAGTTYSVSQVGADTVIDMVGGGKMILVGVAASSLAGAWIFGA